MKEIEHVVVDVVQYCQWRRRLRRPPVRPSVHDDATRRDGLLDAVPGFRPNAYRQLRRDLRRRLVAH